MKKAKTFDEWVRESGAEIVRATTLGGPQFANLPCGLAEYIADLDWKHERHFAMVYADGTFTLLKQLPSREEEKRI